MGSVTVTAAQESSALTRLAIGLRICGRYWHVASLPLLVFTAYALGAQVGMVLRMPDTIPSVVWPPNAILTTALLFVPRRRWGIVFAAAFPAHLLVELGAWSLPLVLAFFATNCSEAAIAALGVRRFSDAPSRFDTLSRVSAFLVWGVVIAPLASSFLDAAAASTLGGEDYWSVWSVRLPSNVLGAVAIVPALSGVLNTSYAELRAWPRQRWLEAAKIAGGILAAAIVVSLDGGNAGLAGVPLVLFLPFLLWAAVKFGTAGAGLALLATVHVIIGSAVYGYSILDYVPAEDRLRVLQLGLIVVAMPLMCLAALVEERRRAEDALRINDLLKSTILKSLPSHVAVLDRDGRIIAVNDSWVDFASSRAGWGAPGIGGSYLDAWTTDARAGEPTAALALEGMQDVLNGTRAAFSMEYSGRGHDGDSWWLMRAVPLKRREGGAVVTHTDMTDAHNAELAARQSRDELAHLSRVFVVGELTTSLSHQLRQPLTGIVGNAQAGRRFLHASKPDIEELRQIFTDILSDAARATELIGGLRDMMRKGSTAEEAVGINAIVEETSRIVMSDAIFRNVGVQLDMAPSLPCVKGNRVQLQQVVLNLLLNALEAVSSHSGGPRVVKLVTEYQSGRGVVVSVFDTGPGLSASAEVIFEPFYTTKASGTGLGLSIARSIVEAHGGTIQARNRQGGGAVFDVTLPPAED
jgi:signal transduction histidine kinase/integral membrane sensor domain MASE1